MSRILNPHALMNGLDAEPPIQEQPPENDGGDLRHKAAHALLVLRVHRFRDAPAIVRVLPVRLCVLHRVLSNPSRNRKRPKAGTCSPSKFL